MTEKQYKLSESTINVILNFISESINSKYNYIMTDSLIKKIMGAEPIIQEKKEERGKK